MEVNYLGHSCFSIHTSGKALLFDPFISENPLAKDLDINSIEADYIFLSHAHHDHTADAIAIAERTGAKIIGIWENYCGKNEAIARLKILLMISKQENVDSILFQEIQNDSDFYFTHSFKVSSSENIKQSICNYGQNFISAFEIDNIYATQFHPELSQKNGLQILNNFYSYSLPLNQFFEPIDS